MTYYEMIKELAMCGVSDVLLHCFTCAYNGGATNEELTELYEALLSAEL